MSQPFSVFSGGGGAVAAFSPTYAPYSVTAPVQHLRQIASGGSTIITVNDAKVNNSVSSTQVSDWQCGLSLPLAISGPSYASSAPLVATIDPSGYVTWVSNGTANITLSAPGLGYAPLLTLTLSTVGGQTSQTFNSWVSGSLGSHVTSQIETLITGVTTFPGISIFTTGLYGATSLTRNSTCWAYGLAGLSAIAVGYSSGGIGSGNNLGVGATAIAADICLNCNHAYYPVGTVLNFVTDDGNNTWVQRTVSAVGHVGLTDIQLLRLSSALPTGITPLPVLPSTLLSYIPGYTWGVPFFTVNGQMSALVYWWFANNIVQNIPQIVSQLSTDSATLNLWQILHNNNPAYQAPPNSAMIIGDSGHVGCLVVNGALNVLMTGWTDNAGGPPGYNQIAAINSEIANLGSSSTVTVTSLSGFPTY